MSLLKDLEITNNFYGITTTKGDIIVNDGTKNTRLPVGTNGYALVANSSQPTGLEWAFINGGGGSSSIAYFNYTLASSPFSTNNTSYVPINDLANTPELGNYVMLLSATYSISKATETAEFGFFRDGVLMSGSNRVVGAAVPNKRTAFYMQFDTTFSGTEVMSTRFRSSSTLSTVTLYDASLLLVKFTTATQYNVVGVEFATNATTPVEIPDMTNTPALNVYLVLFSGTFSITKNNKSITFGLYKNASLINASAREYGALPNTKTLVQLMTVVSFSGSDSCKVKINVSDSTVDGIVYDRSLILIPLN